MQFTLTLSPSLYRGEPPDILGPDAGRAVVDMLQVGADPYCMGWVPTYPLHPLALGHRVEQGGLRGHLAPAHNNSLREGFKKNKITSMAFFPWRGTPPPPPPPVENN